MVASKLVILGVAVVGGQLPDLREGDCVRALDDIDYEHMPKVKKSDRGMVTGKGVLWEDRDWLFANSPSSKKDLLAQRNAIIHRSMVEKLPESEGYGVIKLDDPIVDQCWTVFELDAFNDGRTPQSAKIQLWECVPGWTDQMFIYPACGAGPGQIRWAKDPRQCVYRQIQKEKLVLAACEWTQPFIFNVEKDSANTSPFEDAKTATALKHIKVGVTEYNPPDGDQTAKKNYEDGLYNGQYNKDTPPSCFKVSEPRQEMKTPLTADKPNFAHSSVDPACEQRFLLPGQWDSETV